MLRVKRYLVKDMQEALQRIKEDLGKDAIIISSTKVRAKGIRGFFGAKMLEVTAAVERVDEKIVEQPQAVAPAAACTPALL
jgi:flagellar biosynthesis protein FlhF